MKYRKLRIAFSAVCGILCLLLIVLWVRSEIFLEPADHYLMGHQFRITSGDLVIDERWINTSEEVARRNPSGWVSSGFGYVDEMGWSYSMPVARLTLPVWWATAPLIILATFPWLRWRFSLRTLLNATTLVAVVLGLVIFAAR